jgi:tRNA1Val (adenine37-N6)-methyltransferase
MSNDYFKFQQFTIHQDRAAMKVGIDSVLLGSWVAVDGSEKNVLDIGTGTGLLALMMAQRIAAATVVACDVDENACRQAAENISSSKWSDRISVINIDVKAYRPNIDGFDLIICNPPYFEKSLKSHDSRRNCARHNDSLSFPDLIDCVHRLLRYDGRFALIVPENTAGRIIQLAGDKKMFPVRRLNVKPTESKPVTRVILELCCTSQPPDEQTLTVRIADNYSDEYARLTEDFYLKVKKLKK